MREFETGATRNTDDNKYDYEGFLSPLALRAYAEYMHKHRTQADGKIRASDNWQKGIPEEAYMKSLWRHFMDLWLIYDGYDTISPETGKTVDKIDALAAIFFNVQGLMHEDAKPEEEEEDKPTVGNTYFDSIPKGCDIDGCELC